jgi:hypothetical protein
MAAPAGHYYLGYDPGGRNANGVSILCAGPSTLSFDTRIVDSVDQALKWFQTELGGAAPAAIGVDTYLFWETGPQGWRAADLWLRERYPLVGNSVCSSNSAFGSMAVQGMSLAIKARTLWPQVKLVEAHPKVLYFARTRLKYAWPGDMTAWLHQEVGFDGGGEIRTEHEWDALISAWAAYQGTEGRWPRDLRELSPQAVEPAMEVSYWWPE